jgi:hypothetical protein
LVFKEYPRTDKTLSQNLADRCFICEDDLISFCSGIVLKQVFSFGKFYGSTCRKLETPIFAFEESMISSLSKFRLIPQNAHFLFVINGEYEAMVKGKSKAFLPGQCFIFQQNVSRLFLNGKQKTTIHDRFFNFRNQQKLSEEIKSIS